MPWVGLRFVIVVFPDHTHSLFVFLSLKTFKSWLTLQTLIFIAFCSISYWSSLSVNISIVGQERAIIDKLVSKVGTFHLGTSVYLLCALIPSFAHDSVYHLCTFFTPDKN